MGASFWSSPSGDLSCHFDLSPLGRALHHHDEVAGRWCSAPPPPFLYFPFWSCAPLSPMDCNPLHCFPPSFPTAQATVQPDSCLLQTDCPPSLLISKYRLMVLSPPLLVPVVLECMSHAPNATHPIPCPSPLAQLPPASQLKPFPSSKSRLVY